jgi:uncharacterized phage protein gp47/JayE
VLGTVWGGAVHLLYGYLDWLSKQLFATTAEREALLAQGGDVRHHAGPAVFATGNVTATGANGTRSSPRRSSGSTTRPRIE